MFETLETFDTEFSADSVEWCPTENFEDIFVCGTYQLTSKDDSNGITNCNETKKRIGRIYLFQVIKDNEKLKLKLLQRIDVAAVLDMKWAHVKCCGGRTLLGVVNAEGYLQIYELINNEETISLKLLTEASVGSSSILALSLDWSTGKKDNRDVKITVSDSKGGISLFKLSDDDSTIEQISSWHAHDYEAWITAFDYWNTNVVYTGGDDCKFLRFDTRIDPAVPTSTNRCHNAGVTSLHCSWRKEFCLVSGSYDETLRTWDLRSTRRPLGETNLGGGIWRLKWDPYSSRYLLAAGMYNGFFIVDCDNLESPEIVAEYKEHESIAYGCDWTHLIRRQTMRKMLLEDECMTVVGTCSFYDHVLKLSTVKLDELKIE